MFLDGENIKPSTKKATEALIGKRVQYLMECDIDKSGRGYFFPKYGVVEGYYNKHIIIDNDYLPLSDLRELIICEEKGKDDD